MEINSFDGFKKRIQKFKDELPYEKNDRYSFLNFFCYALRYILTQKETACNESEMKENLPDDFYDKIFEMKESLALDLRLNTFERKCLEVNELLMLEELFLRVSEMKKKYR